MVLTPSNKDSSCLYSTYQPRHVSVLWLNIKLYEVKFGYISTFGEHMHLVLIGKLSIAKRLSIYPGPGYDYEHNFNQLFYV